jgi:hypothetical protein
MLADSYKVVRFHVAGPQDVCRLPWHISREAAIMEADYNRTDRLIAAQGLSSAWGIDSKHA